MKALLLAPHNDDEALFASFTCIREKPSVVVVTDSWIQFDRGDGITAEQRKKESEEAMAILGCSVSFLGIPDNTLGNNKKSREVLRAQFKKFSPDVVYAPAIQGGNKHHDLVGLVALECFPNVLQYTTYSKQSLYTKGEVEIVPTPGEFELKERALACYKTQQAHPWTAPHFAAVEGKSEWLIRTRPWLTLLRYRLGI